LRNLKVKKQLFYYTIQKTKHVTLDYSIILRIPQFISKIKILYWKIYNYWFSLYCKT